MAFPLRDIVVLIFLLWIVALGFRRPWMLTFAYLYVDLLQPQRLGYSFMLDAPVSLIFGVLAAIGFFFERNRNFRFGLTQSLMLVFIGWFTLTTQWAVLPDESMWGKWDSAWKSVGFSAFIPFLLATRWRIDSVVALIVLAIGLVAGNAALKTLAGGGGYDNLPMLVEVNKGIYESSTISTLAVAIVPLAFYLVRHSPLVPRTRLMRLGAWGIGFSSILVTVGSEARTGLICLVALALMLFWSSRKKFTFIAVGGILFLIGTPFLPQQFTERMATILKPEQEQSASTRLEVWQWTLDFVDEHPWGGGFRVFRINSFEVQMPIYAPDGKTIIGFRKSQQKGRAFHSTYFEVLGELGWLGLGIWMTLMGAIQWQLYRLRQRFRRPEPGDEWIPALSLAVAQAILIYMVGGLFVGIAFQTTIYTFAAVAISLGHYVDRREAQAARARSVDRFRGRIRPLQPAPAV